MINVISPVYDNYLETNFTRDLAFTFRNLFECVNSLKLKELALPLLCTGNYGVNFNLSFYSIN